MMFKYTVIASILIAFLFFALIKNYFIYLRLLKRNRDMANLASDFQFSFQSGLPSRWSLATNLFIKDLELNRMEGVLNNRKIEITDVYYGGWHGAFGSQGFRRTRILVDGTQVPNLPPLGFNELMFSPIYAVRDYLNKFNANES
jgi:hypothetical protein